MLNIEYVKPSELVPYENNAKLHPAEQIEQIKESIRDFGFNDPIAVWKDNKVIEGHGRLIASIELGLDEVPIIRLDNLTDDERKAYTLVHNKLTMNSDFDIGLLNLELDDIDIDMSKFGFESMFDEEFEQESEIKEATYSEKISVVIDCENDEEAERIFNELTEEGYECHISTL